MLVGVGIEVVFVVGRGFTTPGIEVVANVEGLAELDIKGAEVVGGVLVGVSAPSTIREV